jgi:hypothetical protein
MFYLSLVLRHHAPKKLQVQWVVSPHSRPPGLEVSIRGLPGLEVERALAGAERAARLTRQR